MTNWRLLFIGLIGCTSAAASEPELITRAAVQYPIRALDRGIEGWAELSFTVKADGAASNVKVTASYPGDVFNKAAISAVTRSIYAPTSADRPGQTRRILFSLLHNGTARSAITAKLDTAMTAARDKQLPQADAVLKEFEKNDELTLVEYAFLERARGTRRFVGGDYANAASNFDRLLDILGPTLSANATADIQRLLVMARVNAGQFAQALADFDRFDLAANTQGADLTPTMAAIRSALANGQPLNLKTSPPP